MNATGLIAPGEIAPDFTLRAADGATYTPYTSSSLDAQSILDGLNATPGGSSKLCLSCHDGTLAIGNVNVLNGNANATIPMQGTGPGGVGRASASASAASAGRSFGADAAPNPHATTRARLGKSPRSRVSRSRCTRLCRSPDVDSKSVEAVETVCCEPASPPLTSTQ